MIQTRKRIIFITIFLTLVASFPNVAAENFNPASHGSPHPRIKRPHPPCCNHPYWHSVYRALSDDGIHWKEENILLKEHVSVPAILQKNDGTFILYYVNGEVDTFDCAFSKDGKTFTDGNCTIYGFTEKKAWDPHVVKLDNGFYRLFFFAPSDGSRRWEENHKLMSAISQDGINWLQEEGVRFQHPGVLDPAVIKMGNIWRLYAGKLQQGQMPIVVAKSDDGLNFAKETELNLGGGVPDIVKLDSGKYALYFCGQGIQMVTSNDGIRWSKKETAIAPDPGFPPPIICDPSVIKTQDGKWVMYYKKAPGQGAPPSRPPEF